MIQLMITLLYVQDSGYGPTIAIFIALGAIGFLIRWLIGEDGNRFEHHSHHEEHESHDCPPPLSPPPVVLKNYESFKIIHIRKGDRYRVHIPVGFRCSYSCDSLSLDGKEGFYVGVDANQERIALISANPIHGCIPCDDRGHTLYLSYYNKEVIVCCKIERPDPPRQYDLSATVYYR